jgi:hypothetical protein
MRGIRGQGSGVSGPAVGRQSIVHRLSFIGFSGPCPLSPVPSRSGPEKGDSPHLPERPEGCCAQMGTVPFFRPRGISLLEVLVSIGILSVGLLAVAMMIPIGKLAISETNRSDRTGACGRAGLRDVRVRGMLNYGQWWAPPPAPPGGTAVLGTSVVNAPIVIDPLGYANSLPATLGGIPRYTLWEGAPAHAMSMTSAETIFRWHDDLKFSLPEEIKVGAPPAGSRPVVVGAAGTYEGNFSWFLTVTPSPVEAGFTFAQRTMYSISVVVCQGGKRLLAGGEQTYSTATTPALTLLGPIANGGAGIILSASTSSGVTTNVKENQWIMLCGGNPVQAKWYRVANAGPPQNVDASNRPSPDPVSNSVTLPRVDQYLMLVGPDLDTTAGAIAVIVDGVTGVYTTTVQLN